MSTPTTHQPPVTAMVNPVLWVALLVTGMLGAISPGAEPNMLRYTYNFENDQASAVAADFVNELPAGLVWDTGFVPLTTNGLEVAVTYHKGDSEARVDGMLLPPGVSQLTLRTKPTAETGLVTNVATITPLVDGHAPIDASADIELWAKFFDVPLEGNILLVIDASGSMNSRYGNTTRFRRVVQEAVDAISGLVETQNFSVVTFNGGLHWSDGSGDLRPANASNKQAMIESLLGLTARGATDYSIGLSYAMGLATPADQVVFLSDGLPNRRNYLDETDDLVTAGVKIDTIGIGHRQSQAPLEEMAELSGGSYRFVAVPGSSGTLSPPDFSKDGNDYDYDQFPIALILTNPNSDPDSRIRYSVNNGSFQYYGGPIEVGYDTLVEAYVESTNVAWNPSSIVGETYNVKDYDAQRPQISVSADRFTDEVPEITLTLVNRDPAGLSTLIWWFSTATENDAVAYTGPVTLSADDWETFAGDSLKEVKIYARAVGAKSFVVDGQTEDQTIKNETTVFLLNLKKPALREPEFVPDSSKFEYTSFPVLVSLSNPNEGIGEINYRIDGGPWQDYTAPVSVGYNAELTARVKPRIGSEKDSYRNSPEVTEEYFVVPVGLDKPGISVSAKVFSPDTQTITVTLTNPNPPELSNLTYWWDGQSEATQSVPYTGPFTLDAADWESFVKPGKTQAKLLVRAVGSEFFVAPSSSEDFRFENEN